MKIIASILLALAYMQSWAVPSTDQSNTQVCINVPGRGSLSEKAETHCRKGDIIRIDERNMPFYCDFNYAIVHSRFNNLICVYRGSRRELREGTNF